MSDDVEVMGYALAHGVGNINVERKIKIRQEHSIVSLFTWNERDRKSTNTILRRIVLRSRLTMGMVISGFYFPISESAN
jgi:hypothetical protein